MMFWQTSDRIMLNLIAASRARIAELLGENRVPALDSCIMVDHPVHILMRADRGDLEQHRRIPRRSAANCGAFGTSITPCAAPMKPMRVEVADHLRQTPAAAAGACASPWRERVSQRKQPDHPVRIRPAHMPRIDQRALAIGPFSSGDQLVERPLVEAGRRVEDASHRAANSGLIDADAFKVTHAPRRRGSRARQCAGVQGCRGAPFVIRHSSFL